MPASVNSLSAICYGLGLIAFLAFSSQLAFRLMGNWRTRALLAASAITALWELIGLATAIWPDGFASLAYALIDSARYGAWLLVIGLLLPNAGADGAKLEIRNHRLWIAIVDDARVAAAKEATHHGAAHASEADHCELHRVLL